MLDILDNVKSRVSRDRPSHIKEAIPGHCIFEAGQVLRWFRSLYSCNCKDHCCNLTYGGLINPTLHNMYNRTKGTSKEVPSLAGLRRQLFCQIKKWYQGQGPLQWAHLSYRTHHRHRENTDPHLLYWDQCRPPKAGNHSGYTPEHCSGESFNLSWSFCGNWSCVALDSYFYPGKIRNFAI